MSHRQPNTSKVAIMLGNARLNYSLGTNLSWISDNTHSLL